MVDIGDDSAAEEADVASEESVTFETAEETSLESGNGRAAAVADGGPENEGSAEDLTVVSAAPPAGNRPADDDPQNQMSLW